MNMKKPHISTIVNKGKEWTPAINEGNREKIMGLIEKTVIRQEEIMRQKEVDSELLKKIVVTL